MARRDLADILYALARGPLARGPLARGHGNIYQANPDWTWYNIYHLGMLTNSYVGPFGSLYKRPSEF